MTDVKKNSRLVGKGMILPFMLVSSLFFLWGFSRSLLDVLNKHFQDTLSISITQSALIQGSVYLAYALMALPAGFFITNYGYKRGLVAGLLMFSTGSFLFIPGSLISSFALFLIALFVIGCGLAWLETSSNPYISILGPSRTAASRLNLSQSLNGLGCMCGPVVMGSVLFGKTGQTETPVYIILGALTLIVALLFSTVSIPEPQRCFQSDSSVSIKDYGHQIRRLWGNPSFRAGFMALLCYEAAEIGINSLFINYAVSTDWLSPLEAAKVLGLCALGLFFATRLIGSYILAKVRPGLMLFCCSVLTVVACFWIASGVGPCPQVALFLCYLGEAIMFPTIFAITIERNKCDTKIASSLLMMTPLGGAAGTLLMGCFSSQLNVEYSLWIPCLAFIAVLLFSFKIIKEGK